MFQEFLYSQMNRANYEIIDNGKQYYGELSHLRGVWAVGKSLEECRQNLLETLEGWVLLRLKKGFPIPDFRIPFRKMPAVHPQVYAEA